MNRPLIVFDTNVIMDVWLKRDGDQSVLLLRLAEEERVDLVVPEYVLIEFTGTALRWIREQNSLLDQQVRPAIRAWARCQRFGEGPDRIRSGAELIKEHLDALRGTATSVVERIKKVARVPPHTLDLHFRGDLRCLSGAPPDRLGDGLKDCRIYEAVLDIARADASMARSKFFVSKDEGFGHAELVEEMKGLGFAIRKDPGQLFGELREAQ